MSVSHSVNFFLPPLAAAAASKGLIGAPVSVLGAVGQEDAASLRRSTTTATNSEFYLTTASLSLSHLCAATGAMLSSEVRISEGSLMVTRAVRRNEVERLKSSTSNYAHFQRGTEQIET